MSAPLDNAPLIHTASTLPHTTPCPSPIPSKEVVLRILHAGDMCGEVSCIMDMNRTATVTALESTLLLELSQHNFRNFLVIVPQILTVVHDKILSYHLNLRYFIHNPIVLEYFKTFLEHECSSENIEFWLLVKEFRSTLLQHPPPFSQQPRPLLRTQHTQAPPHLSSYYYHSTSPNHVYNQHLLQHHSTYYYQQEKQETFEREQQTMMMNNTMKEKAKNIIETYIGSTAPKQVNLKHSIESQLLRCLQQNLYTPLMFVEAETEILQLMSNDSFKRFTNGEVFIQCLESVNSPWSSVLRKLYLV